MTRAARRLPKMRTLKSECEINGHIWKIHNERGHDNVSCACCYQCLSVDQMLVAYVKASKKDKVWP